MADVVPSRRENIRQDGRVPMHRRCCGTSRGLKNAQTRNDAIEFPPNHWQQLPSRPPNGAHSRPSASIASNWPNSLRHHRRTQARGLSPRCPIYRTNNVRMHGVLPPAPSSTLAGCVRRVDRGSVSVVYTAQPAAAADRFRASRLFRK